MRTETVMLVGGSAAMFLMFLGFIKPGAVMSEELVDKVLGLISSKRFAALMLLVGLVFYGPQLGMNPEQIRTTAMGLGAFILSDGIRPTETTKGRAKRLKKEQAAIEEAVVTKPRRVKTEATD